METKTITQGRDGCKVSGAYKLIFPIRKDYYHIRNDGTETAYASVFSDSTDTAEDGVYDIPSGGTLCIRSHGSDTLYVSGEVTVMGTASAVCPFKIGLRGGDITAKGDPVQLDGLQGGVPFSEMVVSGDNIIGQDLTVNVCGKNLLPAMSNSVTRNGITYTVNADGTITLNGTAEKADGVDVITKTPLKAGVYTLSGCPEGGSGTSFALRAGLGTTNTLYGRDYGNGLKITAETDTVITVTIQNAEIGRVFDNLVFRPQLELGDTATEFEAYHGAEYTVTPDSNPYVIPNDIRQQDGLNTISVSAGTMSVTGVRKNAAIKRIWDEIDEIKTAIIVSNGETE